MNSIKKVYTIVKHADDAYCNLYFSYDPKHDGVRLSFSEHESITGKALNIKETYEDLAEAQKDKLRMIMSNPCGGYAVCPVIFE